ncbi:MAG: aminotransferase class I/II-fold pyridoxal phosphate-dependent enzyme [Candidatus Latescibacterota bacterium]|nr:MAG: aminotransferase class I/II-fold pyridoxal phosphate-dependent enzyme [Candidatus Latescibacterota bacterium]
MAKQFERIDTKLVHSGEHPRYEGAVTTPIFQSAMFETYGGEGYHDIKYIRLNNTPNHAVLHAKLAAIENAESALVTSSGMAAITSTLLTLLAAGDHLLIQSTLYGGTDSFVTDDIPRLGIEFDFIDPADPGSWHSKLRPNTKVIYVETISNPLIEVGDLRAVVAFAKEHGLVSMIDNTFASPVNFRPIDNGFDLSLHSCTKYLNGHSDIVAGAVIGSNDMIEKIKHKLDHLGATLDPHACFLLQRGLKTLALRVKCQNGNALGLAKFLDSHAAIGKVNYPALESSPYYERARDLFDGCGGMLSFDIAGDLKTVDRFMRKVRIPIIAPSLGGTETLLTRPAVTSHAGMSPEDRSKKGIHDTLIRMSVGIESIDDLIEDLDQALGG